MCIRDSHTGVKLLIGIPSFRWRYGKRCGQIDHIFLLRNWKINVLPFSLHGFPAPFRRRFPALPLGGLSPGIPCRRSCGFQGPTGKTATKKPSQNRPCFLYTSSSCPLVSRSDPAVIFALSFSRSARIVLLPSALPARSGQCFYLFYPQCTMPALCGQAANRRK